MKLKDIFDVIDDNSVNNICVFAENRSITLYYGIMSDNINTACKEYMDHKVVMIRVINDFLIIDI